MIVLITGIPGHGKTLKAVELLNQFSKENRVIYSNIDGLKLPGVIKIDTETERHDWTLTPEGSVVCYDEAQQIFPPEGRGGRSERHDIAQMEVHRHSGHDLVLVTQSPKLIHSHVRRLVGRHYHVERVMGMKHARVYVKDGCIDTEQSSALKASDVETWAYPTKLFDLYKSATMHQKMRRIDSRVKWYALTAVGVIGLLLVLADRASSVFSGDFIGERVGVKEAQATSISTPVDTPEPVAYGDDWAARPTLAAVSGCVASKRKCQCWDPEGEPLALPVEACYRAIEEPLTWRVLKVGRGG